MKALILAPVVLSLAVLGACKSEGSKGGDESAAKGDDSPALEMSSDSATCKKAMKCCVAVVKAEKGKAKIEDINLKCSGVALASSDDECSQFQKGYAMTFESKEQPVPAECK